MNLLSKVIRAKGYTIKDLSKELSIGYHSLFKVVECTRYLSKKGIVHQYQAKYIRKAVAEWLGLPFEHVWGPNAAFYLKSLLREEIEKQAEAEKEQRLRALGL